MKKYNNQIVIVKSSIHKKLSKKLIESKKYFTIHQEFKGFSISTDLDAIRRVTNFITFKIIMNDMHSCPTCNTRTGYFQKKIRWINNQSKEIFQCIDCCNESDQEIELLLQLNNEERYQRVLSSLSDESVQIETLQIQNTINEYGIRKSLSVV